MGDNFGDLDNDGDLDLVVNNLNMESFVYRNEAARRSDRHSLQLTLDGEGEKDAPIAADVVKITGELKNKDGELIPFEYPLIAVDPTDEDPPKAFKFENSRPSRDLLTRAKQGEAMKAALEFEVDGKQYKGAIKHDHH